MYQQVKELLSDTVRKLLPPLPDAKVHRDFAIIKNPQKLTKLRKLPQTNAYDDNK